MTRALLLLLAMGLVGCGEPEPRDAMFQAYHQGYNDGVRGRPAQVAWDGPRRPVRVPAPLYIMHDSTFYAVDPDRFPPGTFVEVLEVDTLAYGDTTGGAR